MSHTNASFIDLLDIFRQEYHFSNRVSTTTGKMATLLYLVFFMYLAISAIMNVLSRETKNSYLQQVFDLNFAPDSNYYKKFHVITSVGVFRNDNAQVDQPDKVLEKYLNLQVSYISSTCYDYKTVNLYDSQVYINNNMVTYFTTYSVNTLNDFLKISMEKMPLVTTKENDEFFRNYTIKIHIDYYFLKNQELMFTHVDDLFSLLRSENGPFDEFGYFDYILQTKNQDYLVVNQNNYKTSSNNILLYFNPYILNLDTGVMFSTFTHFYGFFQSDKIKNEFSNSIASFEFRITPKIQKYFFSFKKIATSFGEIAGIMNFMRFLMYVYVILITFIKRNQYFSDQLFHREVKVKNYDPRGRDFAKKLFNPKFNQNSTRRMEEKNLKDASENLASCNARSSVYTIPHQGNNFMNLPIENSKKRANESSLKVRKSACGKLYNLILANRDSLYVTYRINDRLHIEEVKQKLTELESALSPMDYKTKIKTVMGNLEGTIEKKSYSCLKFITRTFCAWCYREKHSSLKRLILYKFYEKNLDKMDIIQVQKKLSLIDILSYILLEPRHLALLNYVKKEQIMLDYASGETDYDNPYCKVYSNEEIVEMFNSKNEMTLSDPRDRKLLEILEPELSKTLVKKT